MLYGIKIKITAKFCASRRLPFQDTKIIMSPEKFRDFRETGPRPDTRIEIAQQILGTPIGGKQTS